MFPRIFCLVVCLAFFVSHRAVADDVCNIVALHDVGSVEDPTTIMKAGSEKDSITQYQVDASTHVASFCQHGGLCWPEKVTINGQGVTALKLTNCSIDRQHPSPDADTVFYDLVPDRSKIPQSVMRESDVADRLMNMGMCHACAQNAAAFYVHEPKSQCGKTTNQPLKEIRTHSSVSWTNSLAPAFGLTGNESLLPFVLPLTG